MAKILYNILMSWRNLLSERENSGDRAAVDWLPEICDYGIGEVVCVAGKNPDDEKILKNCMVTGWNNR